MPPTTTCRLVALLSFALPLVGTAAESAKETNDVTIVEPSGPPSTLFGLLFGRDNLWDSTYDEWAKWKEEHHIPITIGAQHWWHVDRDQEIYGDGYGVPGQRGTYYYFLQFDPSYKFDEGGFFKEVGVYFQGRIRDDHDRVRNFYSQNYWSYEMYAYATTTWGTFRGGQIVKEFGIPWEGSWWEGTPYFDGFKFDPDYGIGWNKEFNFNERFSIPVAAQFFFKEDGINGTIAGADPESIVGLTEQNTAVLRVVPTVKITPETTLAVGFSGLVGEIDGSENFVGVDDRQGAWGADLTLTYKGWTVFGEFIRSYGAISPARYVSGGPSDLRTTYRVGLLYNWGPFTFHTNYSKEEDLHPTGHQHIFNVGVNTQLTKNVTLYTEYVNWNVVNSAGVKSKYDDGFEMVVAWTF